MHDIKNDLTVPSVHFAPLSVLQKRINMSLRVYVCGKEQSPKVRREEDADQRLYLEPKLHTERQPLHF